MNEHDYRAKLNQLEDVNRSNLIDLAVWAKDDALPWLWSELGGMTSERKAKPLQPHDAIRQGLHVTYADYKKMPLRSSFYVAQMTMLDSEVNRYCSAVNAFSSTTQVYAENATIHTLHGALKSHLDHGIILLEQAGHLLLELPAIYGAWSRRVDDPFEIYKGAEQIVYGVYSGLTHSDRAPYTPVAVLRTAIEIRIRSAFCIQGYIDPSNNSLVPIDLGRLFDAVKCHLPKITFAVDFHDVQKVYRWSNFYLHGGWRDFPWVVGYALQFLRPLFADPNRTPTGGWTIYGGIRMRRKEWRAIRAHFELVESNRNIGLFQNICNLIRNPFSQKVRRRNLVLNHADEQDAKCLFLD